jgi:AlwI restriction endonuclease
MSKTNAAIEVPQAEAPAYFEWILWRAFLAINSLANKPYEARRFKIDQDFLPVGTAPGNGPDLIFEFDDFVMVVEVTLTDNSRQEAAEGEPVRRHVADLVTYHGEQSGKPVYGLFIANRIDSNTAETFRNGVWFTRTDDKLRLDITPVTLEQFKAFFAAMFTSGRVEVGLIRELLDLCGDLRPNYEAPAWKQEIALTVQQQIAHYTIGD